MPSEESDGSEGSEGELEYERQAFVLFRWVAIEFDGSGLESSVVELE